MSIISWRVTAACLTLLLLAAAVPQNQAFIEAFLNQGTPSGIGTACDATHQSPDLNRVAPGSAVSWDDSSVDNLLHVSRQESSHSLSYGIGSDRQRSLDPHAMLHRNRAAKVPPRLTLPQAPILLSQNANSVRKLVPMPSFHLTQSYLASAPSLPNYQLNQYAASADANPDANLFSGRNLLSAFLGGSAPSPAFDQAAVPSSSNAQGYLNTALEQASIAISAAETAGSGDDVASRRSAAQSAHYAAQAARSAADRAASAAGSLDSGYAAQARDAASRAQEAADQASASAESVGW